MRKREELTAGCMAKAGAEEMCFVLLSRDAAAPATIRFWAHKRVQLGKNDPDDPQIIEAEQCARVMEAEGGRHRPAPAGEPIQAWRYAADFDEAADPTAIEVLTGAGWALHSTGPHVDDDLAALRRAGVPRVRHAGPGSVLAALRLLDALAGRLHGRSADLPPDLADLGADVAEVARELEATLPPGPEPEPAG